jgi:spore coat polysaccharide biosynthesis predicted glycosyltransferase SpsG
MKSAIFIVDAGRGVGLGHLRRSGFLLDAMKGAGFDCRLYCQDVEAAAAIGRQAAKTPDALEELPAANVVICDSYLLDSHQLGRLRSRGRLLLAFDDMGQRPIDADIVLNHNLYGSTIDYTGLTNAVVLAGPECTLVDPGVVKARMDRKTNPGIGVALSFGGTDDGGRAVPLVRLLVRNFGGPFHIVVAPGITPSIAATELAAEMPDIVHLHRGPDLPALLATSRLYLGGAGMTALEALVIGLDMIVCIISDNQRLNATAFASFGHAVMEGFNPKKLAEVAVSVLRAPFVPHPKPVDGKGAERVVSAIEHLLDAKLQA